MAAAGLEAQPRDVGRLPRGAPIVEDEPLVDPQLRLAERVGDEQGVLAGGRDREEPRPPRGEAGGEELGRQAHGGERRRRAAVGHRLRARRRGHREPGGRRHREGAGHLAVGEEGRGEAPRLARPVERHRRGQGPDVLRPAEARVRRVVPEEPPAPRREEEGDDDLPVPLPEVEVAAGDVEQAVLVLAEAVERLARGGLELLAHEEGRLAVGLHRREGLPAARRLAQERPSGLVLERHLAGGERHPRREAGCAQHGGARLLARLEGPCREGGYDGQRGPGRLGRPLRPGHDPHRALREHPQPHVDRRGVHDEAVVGLPPGGGLGGRGHRQENDEREQRHATSTRCPGGPQESSGSPLTLHEASMLPPQGTSSSFVVGLWSGPAGGVASRPAAPGFCVAR